MLFTLDTAYTKWLRKSPKASCGCYAAETAGLTAIVFEAKYRSN